MDLVPRLPLRSSRRDKVLLVMAPPPSRESGAIFLSLALAAGYGCL